jgi:peptidoglycan/xylan/chitin deacetylase (PgdA/CDA1 family)
MSIANLRTRVRNKYVRSCAEYLFRRPFRVDSPQPVISFTFDDFPRSALSVGGAILRKYGLAGTYYVSLDLAGKQDASGAMFTFEDLATLREQGHELGCHTFSHCDSSGTPSSIFVESVRANQRALDRLYPGDVFRSFSYPKSAPRGRTKQMTAQRFTCCRGGGQTLNAGITDLNYLKAFFIEQARGLTEMREIVDQTCVANGWLIFATHDVCDNPSPYGCTPEVFEAVVQASVQSGALILPVGKALETLRGNRAAA